MVMLLAGMAVMIAATAVMLFIFFKAPVKKGGPMGGLDSMDPEQRAEWEERQKAYNEEAKRVRAEAEARRIAEATWIAGEGASEEEIANTEVVVIKGKKV